MAHRLSQAAAADRVVVLSEGRVVENGTHEELLAARGSYAALWHAWSDSRSPAGPATDDGPRDQTTPEPVTPAEPTATNRRIT